MRHPSSLWDPTGLRPVLSTGWQPHLPYLSFLSHDSNRRRWRWAASDDCSVQPPVHGSSESSGLPSRFFSVSSHLSLAGVTGALWICSAGDEDLGCRRWGGSLLPPRDGQQGAMSTMSSGPPCPLHHRADLAQGSSSATRHGCWLGTAGMSRQRRDHRRRGRCRSKAPCSGGVSDPACTPAASRPASLTSRSRTTPR
ncbi:unnamed protein product [Urochloa humidicola]